MAELRLYLFSSRITQKQPREWKTETSRLWQHQTSVTSNPNTWVRTAKCHKGQLRVWESDGRECSLGQMSDQACASFLQSKCFTLRGKSRTSTVLNSGDRLGARTFPQTRPGTKSHRHMSDIQEAVCQGERGQGEAAWGSTRLPTPDVWGQERLVAPLTGGIFKGSFGEARPLPEGFSASLQAGEESPRPQMNDSFKRIQHTLNCTVKCCISIECSRSPGRPAEKVQEKLTANIRTKKCYHVNKNIRLRIKRKRMGTGTPSCSKVCGAEAQALSPSWDTSR